MGGVFIYPNEKGGFSAADGKKSIPDAGKVDIPHVGKGRACQCCSPAQGQSAPAKAEAPKDKGSE